MSQRGSSRREGEAATTDFDLAAVEAAAAVLVRASRTLVDAVDR